MKYALVVNAKLLSFQDYRKDLSELWYIRTLVSNAMSITESTITA